MPQREAAAIGFSQTCSQQGLKPLAIGDAGQRVLLGEALQGVFQHAALADMTQATTQAMTVERTTHQPVDDAHRFAFRLGIEQQDYRKFASSSGRLQAGRGEKNGVVRDIQYIANSFPTRRADEDSGVSQRSQALA